MGTLVHVGLHSNHLNVKFTIINDKSFQILRTAMYIGGNAIDSNKHKFVLMITASYMD